MADKEIEPSPANAPTMDASAIDAAPADSPSTEESAIDAAPADAPSTEALDAARPAPTASGSHLSKKDQEIRKTRARNKATRPKPIPTPVDKIVALKQIGRGRAGKVVRVTIDNSNKTNGANRGYVQATDSTGEGSEKWYRPGAFVEIDQKEKDAFERKEKESGDEPYYLGDDDDASESEDDDEALEKPPVAKDAEIGKLGTTSIRELRKYVDGPRDATRREQKARDFAALLAD